MATVSNVTQFKLDPSNQLVFPQPSGGQKVQTTMSITNTHESALAFKVKTTNPKSYLVRPSTGVINVGESATITIQMSGTVSNEKDRFLVQSTPVANGERASGDEKKWLKELFSKGTVQDARLAVVFSEAAAPSADAISATFTTVEANTQVSTQKYNQIVNYALIVEKQNQSLVKQIQEHHCNSQAGSNFQLWHMIVAMILAVVLAKGLEIVF